MVSFSSFRKVVLLEQTLFGLPWVFATALLALTDSGHPFPSLLTWFWIVVAFSAARSSGMAFNRLIDQQIDGKNSRTLDRPLQTGLVTKWQVTLVAWGSAALFLLACGMLNPLCLRLSPFAVFLFWAYSYAKRFTACCHFVLGLVHLLGPVFAWIVVTGEFSVAAFWIGLAVFASIAANDIIYAFQDEEFDRMQGLYSMPVALGKTNSLWLVRGLHLFAILALIEAGLYLRLTPLYFLGILAMGMIYLYYHLQLKVRGPERCFFLCNAQVALTFLAISVEVVVWQRLL